MSSLSVKAPKPDPALLAAQKSEQHRADAAFVTNTQDLLSDEMRKRARRFGSRVSLAGTPGVAGPYSPGAASGSGGAGYGGVPLTVAQNAVSGWFGGAGRAL